MYPEYRACYLCPRACGVDRRYHTGVCGEPSIPGVARYLRHFGEEPPITGVRGSGTVFFTGCPLGCRYCQNHQISRRVDELPMQRLDTDGLVRIYQELAGQGAHNINLVTPTHFTPHIAESIRSARAGGLSLPFISNNSGYESLESLRALDGLIDIWLPDLKYSEPHVAARYSRAPDYPLVALRAVEYMLAQAGQLVVDQDGFAIRGVIIRHLVLPGHPGNTYGVLYDIVHHFGADVAVSVMFQYSPSSAPEEIDGLEREVNDSEREMVLQWIEELEISGWVQEPESAGICIPDFTDREPFEWG